MSDFTRELYLDPAVSIKTEPILSDGSTIMITSASVPIPSRPDYRDYGIDIENSQSPIYSTTIFSDQLQLPNQFDGNVWGDRLINADEMLKSEALIHMDDDDIFQVDKADLIQGPTLAELNANDENLLGDLNFDDLLLPEENSYISLGKAFGSTMTGCLNNNQVTAVSSLPNTSMFFYRELDSAASSMPTTSSFDQTKTPVSTLSPNSPTSSNSSLPHSRTSPLHSSNVAQKHSTLHELLMKREAYGSPDSNQLGQSVPSRNMLVTSPNTKAQRNVSRLSSSAPTHLGLEQIWQRREPRKHLLSTSSLAEAGSTSSLSTGGILSPDPQDFSHDEFDSDDDSDAHYEDYSSDNDSDDDREPGAKGPSKKERFFWQYNVQAKGPKGQRLVMKSKMEDPHVLHEITDPVFSPDCSVRGIKHSGKARKGDGNDLTPNARKLYTIGRELDKLGRIINDMTPVSELPFNVRPTSRKEKNKLASRACRLKKKAQHEANKIKLSGLETEHKRLISAISQAKQILAAKMNERNPEKQEELTRNIEKLMKSATKIKVAGHTTEYVNKILDKAKNGGMTVLLEDM